MKRNEELVKFALNAGWSPGAIHTMVNGEVTKEGYIKKRKGYTTFGEMVDVLWNINKNAKKLNFSGEYTVRLPLKGIKPIYKKTLNNL